MIHESILNQGGSRKTTICCSILNLYSEHNRRHLFSFDKRLSQTTLISVAINKRGNPLAGFFFAAEWPVGIVRPVFNGAE